MHPNGNEIVCLLAGAVIFILEQEGENQAMDLKESGAYAIVPRKYLAYSQSGHAIPYDIYNRRRRYATPRGQVTSSPPSNALQPRPACLAVAELGR